MRRADGRLVVAIDGSALSDGRRFAGIGRYAEALIEELGALEDRVVLHVAVPARPPRSNRWAWRWARAQPPLARLAARVRPDLVHSLGSEAALCVTPRRQVVTVHDAVPWSDPAGGTLDARAYLRLQRTLLARAGAVIVPAEVVVGEVASVLGVPRDRVTAIGHGVTPAFTAAATADDASIRTAAGLDRTPYLIWVGSLHGVDPRKGLDLLLGAIRSLRPGDRPVLALVGRHGHGSEWARREALATGIELVMPGFVEDARLAALYRGALAAVVPSRYEGFGLPALEAMACGAPVLVTAAGNSPAVVGDAALVVAPDDAAALADGLRRLLGEPALRERLTREGPLRAAAFSWRRAAERTVEVYERVAGARAGGYRSSAR